jgi:hypothetical protein
MMDDKTFEYFLPPAYEWAKAQEEFVLEYGTPLSPRHLEDARLAGVHDVRRIRVLVVDRIPLPESPDLAAATRNSGIITDDTKCIGFGHAIIIRADSWGDRELLVHNLVHVAQCERGGGLKPWMREYLTDRRNCARFTLGALEQEARELAREICAGNAVALSN